MDIFRISAKDVLAGDELKTSEGFIKVGGIQPLGDGSRVGLLTPEGMLGVGAEDIVTIRRK